MNALKPILVATVVAFSVPASANEVIDSLVEQARQEGALYLNWSDYSDIMDEWTDGFLKTYGLEGAIDVVHTPNPNGTAGFLQLEEEIANGRPAHTDIMEGSQLRTALGTTGFKNPEGFLDTIDYAKLPNVDPSQVKADGRAVVYAHVMPGISYNTNAIAAEDIPQAIDDVVDPEFLKKYRVASNPQASGFDALFADELWGFMRACEFSTKLGGGISGMIQPHEAERLASGEFDMLVFDQGLRPLQLAATGAPVDIVYPDGYTLRNLQHLSIPKHSEHKATAQLFINYLMSPEAQKILYDNYRIDNQDLPGSQSKARLDSLKEKGLEPTDLTTDFITANYMTEIRPAIGLVRKMLAGEYKPEDCPTLADELGKKG